MSLCVCVCVCVCFIALVSRQENRIFLRRTLSSLVYLALPYFFTLCHIRYTSRKKKLLSIECFDFPYNVCLKHFSG
jgi:hypothetical protein